MEKDRFDALSAEAKQLVSILTNQHAASANDQVKANERFEKSMGIWQSKVVDLEKQYGELMKLKKPADYWNKLYEDYTADGEKWRNWAIGVGSVFLLVMSIILFSLPSWLHGDTWKLDHFKGAIILAVIHIGHVCSTISKCVSHGSRCQGAISAYSCLPCAYH